MTLLLRMVVELLVGAAAWLALTAAIGIAVGVTVAAVARRPPGHRRLLVAAILGGAVTMALAHRLRLPEPLTVAVWRRDLFIMWSAIGATAGSLLAVLGPRAALSGNPPTPVRRLLDHDPEMETKRSGRHMSDIMQLLSDDATVVAVVGATDSPGKYGGIIYRDLKRKGYRVVPVNPHRDEVDGDRCYPTLADLAEPPTLVDFVVPPERTLELLEGCLRLGITRVWIQPGAADDRVRAFVAANGFDAIIDACIMVEVGSKTP